MKKALVIVSFGTTYERARRSIDAVERALAQAAEGYDVFRAYTSSIVRKVLKSRGEIVPSLEEALEKLANESYDTVFVADAPALRQRIRRKNPRIVYALCGAIPAWRHR